MEKQKHHILNRQLRRSNLSESECPTNLELWQQFLERVNQVYVDADNERYLSDRSQKISENELHDLYKQLENEKTRLQHIFDFVSEGIITINKKCIIESLNPKLSQMFGYAPDLVVGHNVVMFLASSAHLKTPAQIKKYLQGLVNTHPKELMGLHQDGHSFPIEVSITNITMQEETFYVGFVRDITERKNAEKKEKELNNELMVTARYAGMADVATSVLHNIGNVLNSVGVSITLVNEKFCQSSVLTGFVEVNKLLTTHMKDIVTYLSTDPQGKNIPRYLILLEKAIEEERNNVRNEFESLTRNVELIKNIISMQQALGKKITGTSEPLPPLNLVEKAVSITGFDSTYIINVHSDVEEPIILDQVKLVQILINLIRNAKDAMIENTTQNEKKLVVKILRKARNIIHIEVVDNGIGIQPEDIVKLFSFGFTTKKNGHGYGLHTSALLAKEMGGTLKARSRGLYSGATFVLEVPYDSVNKDKMP